MVLLIHDRLSKRIDVDQWSSLFCVSLEISLI